MEGQSLQDVCATMEKDKHEAETELVKGKSGAGRLVQEAEEKAKAVMASETAPLHAEFDKRLEHTLGRARKEAVMAYRRDQGRAIKQATAYVEGGKYIFGKIEAAFPDQDWSVLPEPDLTEELVDDEHKLILEEIDEGTGVSEQQQ